MAASESVRNYKQLLGQLATAHEKARGRLSSAEAKRAELKRFVKSGPQ